MSLLNCLVSDKSTIKYFFFNFLILLSIFFGKSELPKKDQSFIFCVVKIYYNSNFLICGINPEQCIAKVFKTFIINKVIYAFHACIIINYLVNGVQIDLFLSFVINSITSFTNGFSLNSPFNLLKLSVRFFVAKISL